ncbi:MAG: repair protein SbcC/Rad50 [Clostridia bacterium]|nr:repair protein SbcC/Rad50 [Clostridia bacterium]
MKVNNLKCTRFAGISNKDISFDEGLNVIVGPNEAGKSTIIEGLFAVFFRNHKLKKNTAVDKEFFERFRPYPEGDSMAIKVNFNVEGSDFELSKEWGTTPSIAMQFNGSLIKNEKNINEKLKELLKYGESTYKNIVFARQKDLKEALERIGNDPETTDAVSSILRQAVMVLDGISVEKMKKVIDDKIDKLQGKWDLKNNRPEKGRGIDNPWKVKVGKVLECYYKKERIKQDMQFAQNIEEEFCVVGEKLKELQEKKEAWKKEIGKYSEIEGDILKRAILEPKITALKKEVKELREINKKFPILEENYKNKQEEMTKLNKEKEKLNKEYAFAKKIEAAKTAKELLLKIEKKEEELNTKKEEKEKYVEIKDSDIEKLEKLNNQILTAKASMEAGTLLGKIIKAKGSKVFVTKGLEEKEEIKEGVDFTASGYLKVEVDNDFTLEVRAGKIEFEELRKQYLDARKGFQELLEKLKVSDLTEAKANYRIYRQLINDIEAIKKQIKDLLGDKKLEDLKVVVKEADNLTARSVDEVNAEMENLNKKISNLKAEMMVIENTIKDWTEKYGSSDKVIDVLVSKIKTLEEQEETLKALADLPEGFNSAEEFQNKLSRLRKEVEKLGNEEQSCKDEYYKIEKRLPDTSYEELEPLYKEAEKEFKKQLHYLHTLIRIREVFEMKLEEMDKGSFKPLVQDFSRYLSLLTLGSYNIGEIDENLQVGIVKDDDTKLPVQLFSAGTYDCVLLALRFALINYLFNNDRGFVVLDDCLVNLDPDRKKKAAELIKKFAEKNQVIFTTCDPETADLLGGKIINL